jgi:hypothetical protein
LPSCGTVTFASTRFDELALVTAVDEKRQEVRGGPTTPCDRGWGRQSDGDEHGAGNEE